jgi:hypothetical protein
VRASTFAKKKIIKKDQGEIENLTSHKAKER